MATHIVAGGQMYETVAASQTNQALGVSGGIGDVLDTLHVIPATTAAGTIQIKDGSDTAITVFVAGTLTDLRPFSIRLNLKSRTGAWQVTTGANVSVIACGIFA